MFFSESHEIYSKHFKGELVVTFNIFSSTKSCFVKKFHLRREVKKKATRNMMELLTEKSKSM
jgi:hypothetical protein